MSAEGQAFVDSLHDDELRDALRAAEENITILEGIRDALNVERDRARLEVQRLRERSSVEMAEAKVQYARLLRAHNLQASIISQLEAKCNVLSARADWHATARHELVQALSQLAGAYSPESMDWPEEASEA